MTINNNIIKLKYDFDNMFNSYFGWLEKNHYIKNFILLFLAVYPSVVRPKLPNHLEILFENWYVRFILIAYVIYDIEPTKNIPLAITVSLIFLLIIDYIDNYYDNKNNNKLDNNENNNKLDNNINNKK